MTDRSAEQAPVETRPQGADSRQDTARIPLAERLQRRIAAADERRSHGSNGQSPRSSSSRVLPPMPAELTQQRTEERPVRTAEPTPAPAAPRPAEAEPTQRAVQPVADDNTAAVPVVPGREAARRTPGAPVRAPRRA